MARHLPSRDVDWQGKMALRRHLRPGCMNLYPEFLGVAGPVNRMDPSSDSTLDFLKLLWPDSLSEHIAGETNEYARQVKANNWVDTSGEEVWVLLGIVIEMGIHRVPRIVDYWSRNPLLGIVPVKQAGYVLE